MAQHKLDFWNEVRYNDTKRSEALSAYHIKHPGVAAAVDAETKAKAAGKSGKAARVKAHRGSGVFDVLAYMESIETAVEVMRDIIKKPMTYDEFDKEIIKGGECSNDAKVAWMAYMGEDDAVVATNKKGEKTLEIPIGEQTTYRNRFTKRKTLEGVKKTFKNATQGEVDGAQRLVYSDMQNVMGGSHPGLSEVSKMMAASGASSSSASPFDAGNISVGDVTSLCPERPVAIETDTEPEKETEAPGSSASATSAGEVGEVKEDPPEEKWENLDRLLSKDYRQENAWRSKWEATAKQRLDECDAATASVEKASLQNDLKNEMAIMANAQRAVELIVENTGDELQALESRPQVFLLLD